MAMNIHSASYDDCLKSRGTGSRNGTIPNGASAVRSWTMDSNGYDFTSNALARKHEEVSQQFKAVLYSCLKSSHTLEALEPLSSINEDSEDSVESQKLTYKVVLPKQDTASSDFNCKDKSTCKHVPARKSSTNVNFDSISLEIFGSSVTNLVLPGTSDVDVNVSVPIEDSGISSEYQKQCVILGVQERVGLHPRFRIIEVIPHARVPVIKVIFVTDAGLVDPCVPLATVHGDITFSHSLPRYNSNFLRVNGQWDPLVRRLMLLTKYWASARGIKDASKGFLSSYSFALLAVFYAQQKMGLPVLQKCELTTLQRLGIRSVDEIKTSVPIGEGRKSIDVLAFPDLAGSSLNDMQINHLDAGSHATLFLGFLDFLATFPSDTHTVSVRTGELIPREDVDSSWRWSIEDPFEHLQSSAPRDLGCVLREGPLLELKQEVNRARSHLRRWYGEAVGISRNKQPNGRVYVEKEANYVLKVVLTPCTAEEAHRRKSFIAKLYPDTVQAPAAVNRWKFSDDPVAFKPSRASVGRYSQRRSQRVDGRQDWMFNEVGNLSSSSVSKQSDQKSDCSTDTVNPVPEIGRKSKRYVSLNSSTSKIKSISEFVPSSNRTQLSCTDKDFAETGQGSKQDVSTLVQSLSTNTVAENTPDNTEDDGHGAGLARSVLMQALGVM
eukprot:GHVH01016192.1.p1 GENE.GHVH01016192.1~~GHVH01016192.1.p1  ORF type:complete len:665 (+),score=78.60 GHVH01016192.1:766-2760(+)